MVVIYRKYRPKIFSEIVGQENIVRTLTNAISMGIVSHAYLFYGSRGTGKTTTARLLAKALNCTDKQQTTNNKQQTTNYEPCNQCASCVEINENRAMDLIEIDAASNRGIDEMRNLKEGINIVPAKSKHKVYIIDECHQLTKEASNALLKTLEEPPPYAIFILCTTEYSKVLPTIVSRCQRFEFKKLNLPEIVKRLDFICGREGVKAESGALELIARTAEGSVRDSESLLDEVINLEDKEISKKEVEEILGIVGIRAVSKLVDFLSEKNERDAVEELEDAQKRGADIENFLGKLISYLHNLLLVKISPEVLGKDTVFTKEEKENLKNQEKNFSTEELKKMLKIFLDVQERIRWSDLPRLPFEIAIMDAIEAIDLKQEKK